MSKKENAEQITYELNSIKATKEVFFSLLEKQPFFEVSKANSHIIFGKSNAEMLITVLTNPHCNPCANLHERIENLLETHDICIQYVFVAFNQALDSSNRFLIATYFNHKEDSKYIFRDWFKYGKNDRESFFELYEFDIMEESVSQEFERHEHWSKKTGLTATPIILLNGYKLPDFYKIEDIKYILN